MIEQLRMFPEFKFPIFQHPIWEQVSKDIRNKWLQWHADNPHVYELFKKFALEMRHTGRTRYSARAIYERVRWNVDFETRGDYFKINNNWHPMYARLLALEQPGLFADFFEFREGDCD